MKRKLNSGCTGLLIIENENPVGEKLIRLLNKTDNSITILSAIETVGETINIIPL